LNYGFSVLESEIEQLFSEFYKNAPSAPLIEMLGRSFIFSYIVLPFRLSVTGKCLVIILALSALSRVSMADQEKANVTVYQICASSNQSTLPVFALQATASAFSINQ
jgi:hypothetical protein